MTEHPLAAAMKNWRQQTKTSITAAATMAGITEGRWRQIETGLHPLKTTSKTITGIALTIGADPDQLAKLAGTTALHGRQRQQLALQVHAAKLDTAQLTELVRIAEQLVTTQQTV